MSSTFFDQLGPQTLGSRLRRLAARLTEDAGRVYDLYGVDLDPRWFPVFHVLASEGPGTVSAIARRIGHSHASVSQIVKAMKARGIAESARDDADGRRSVVRLSAGGEALVGRLAEQCRDVSAAVDELLAGSRHDLWAALQDFERALEERSLHARVRDRYEEHAEVRIEDLDPDSAEDAEAFSRLNREWIETFFTLEPADLALLDDPAGIVRRGGSVFMARLGARTIGTCALLHVDGETVELAKMAVTGHARGKGVGELLGRAVIARARELGARRVYLESNKKLAPALRLYRRLEFREIEGEDSPYERCDVRMELLLDQKGTGGQRSGNGSGAGP